MGDPWARARSQTSKQNSQCISVVVGVSVIFWDFSSAGFPLQLDSRCRGMLCVSKSFPQDGQALLTVCDDGFGLRTGRIYCCWCFGKFRARRPFGRSSCHSCWGLVTSLDFRMKVVCPLFSFCRTAD